MFSWRLRYDTDQLFRTFFLSLVGTKILYEEFFKHFYIWTKIVLIIQLSPKVMLCLKWLHLCKKFEWKVCLHYFILFFIISSVQFSCSIVSKSLQPHGLQHARLPCPSPTPRACSDLRPSSQWCHPTISSSVVPFPPAFNLSQHQGLFKWVSSLHQVAKVLEFQLQHQSFQWLFKIDFP